MADMLAVRNESLAQNWAMVIRKRNKSPVPKNQGSFLDIQFHCQVGKFAGTKLLTIRIGILLSTQRCNHEICKLLMT